MHRYGERIFLAETISVEKFYKQALRGQNEILCSNKVKKTNKPKVVGWKKEKKKRFFFPLTAVARTGRLKQLDVDFSQDMPRKND